MATVYSDPYWTGTYTYTRVRVDYSGNSATAILLYTRTNSYAGTTRSGNSTFLFENGVADMSNREFYGQQTDVEVCRCMFTIDSSRGATYSGHTTGDAGLIAFSGSVTIPAQVSKPTGLAISVAEVFTNGARFNVSVSSYGVPSGANGRWIEAGIAGQNAWQNPLLRSAKAVNVSSAQITVNNSSTQTQTLTIRPNTQYYYGVYAWNTAKDASAMAGKLVTKANAPTVTFDSSTTNSATFSYSTTADGGFYNKNIQYSLNNGSTWVTAATVIGGSASSGTFTINNLNSGEAYTIRTRVSTSAGTTEGSSLSFNTLIVVNNKKNKLYGSANGKARETITLYGGVNDEAKLVTKLYGAVTDLDDFAGTIQHPTNFWVVNGFNSSTFATKMKMSRPLVWAKRNTFHCLQLTSTPLGASNRVYRLDIVYRNGKIENLVDGVLQISINSFGISIINPIPTGYPQTSDIIVLTAKIKTKLIHQGFGHIDYT